ncbi:hypothetical protein [Rhizorhabdus histidinilytica]|uniref:hypothetical protein n=1 Tax=Rhizorhabdus histidinilytica TaxID=439228 RepID=UPI00321F930B
MRDFLTAVVVLIMLVAVEQAFGTGASIWLSLVFLAFCLGLFYGSGRRQHTKSERPAIVAWLRSLDDPELADMIERGDHLKEKQG